MKVFISHSHHDEFLAQRIAQVLKKAGLDVWDDREIMPGDNWADKIAKALNESNAMVVLLTVDALKSRSIHRDIEFALAEKRYRKRLIPVMIGSPDKFSNENLPWILKHLPTIKLAEDENNDDALKQIATILLKIAPDTAFQKINS
ncbi:toll/interleukin-1 receptor domain-containing protein [candidate division KSB1 bacterium]|nr:toll/interleukin-1 receptor domain-containing protein [candidate division KSB1 bacterium]